MADEVTISTISVSPTTLSGLQSLTLLNGSETNPITVAIDGATENIILIAKQTLTFDASDGKLLPDITLSGTELTANTVSTT